MHLEIILKVTERCNIDCTYCYFFNGGNEDFRSKPSVLKASVIQDLVTFINREVCEGLVTTVQVDIHGGEPLLLKRPVMELLLRSLREDINEGASVRIALQTNGILISQEWISLFDKYEVSVAVSLDGPEAVNDMHRIDHSGNGTHARTVAGLCLLQQSFESGKLRAEPGVICVADARANGADVYYHLTRDLGIRRFSVLLPDVTRDNFDQANLPGLESYVASMLECWLSDDPSKIHIRNFTRTVSHLTSTAKRDGTRSPVVTVRSDGALNTYDDLRNIVLDGPEEHNIKTTRLDRFLSAPPNNQLELKLRQIPKACTECAFKTVCRGAGPMRQNVSRYSFVNGFDNASVYCSIYAKTYSRIAGWLVRRGFSADRIAGALA